MAGRAVSAFDAFLKLGAGISGLVTGAHGHPLAGVCVGLQDGVTAVTGQNGRYSLTGQEPGSSTVLFSGGCGNGGSLAPQFYNGQASGGRRDRPRRSPPQRGLRRSG